MLKKMKNLEICLSPELVHLYDFNNKNIVIVDIFRASSTMVAALANDVTSITPFMNLEECRVMSKKGYIIAGERNGLTAEGFELGNSPLAFLEKKYATKKIAMTTTNGTVAIQLAKGKAKNILLGAFPNLKATADFLSAMSEDVIILCAGWKGKFNLEDSLYAGALTKELKGNFKIECDTAIALESLYDKHSKDIKGFLSQASHTKRLQNQNIEADIDFCLSLNIYDLVGILRENEFFGEKN